MVSTCLHQLKVVENQQVETLLELEPSSLGGHLQQARVGRVVDVETSLGSIPRSAMNALPVAVGEKLSRAQPTERDPGF